MTIKDKLKLIVTEKANNKEHVRKWIEGKKNDAGRNEGKHEGLS